MKCTNVDQALAEWQRYRKSNNETPFFISVDDGEEYRQLLDKIMDMTGVTLGHVADKCGKDSFPDFDALIEWMKGYTFESVALLGLGEALTLNGDMSFLTRLKTAEFPRDLLVVCRGVGRALSAMCNADAKFDERNIVFLNSAPFPQIVQYDRSLPVRAIDGIRDLISQMEIGKSDEYAVKSDVELAGVVRIRTAFEICRRIMPGLNLPESTLTPDQWREMVVDHDMDGVHEPRNWRTFVSCKVRVHQNPYLRFVAARTNTSVDWEKNLVQGLLGVQTSDAQFCILYNARKGVIGDADKMLLNEYVAKTAIYGEEQYAYLTDGSSAERQAIIRSLQGRETIPDRVKDNYPALRKYLTDYHFVGTHGEILTAYFGKYKVQKVLNRIDSEFQAQVELLADDGNRIYNMLPTRGELIDKAKDKDTQLVWIDGLGVEYLGMIQCLASELKVAIKIQIARANLPTLTSLNNDFYESWPGRKAQTKVLDNIKHGKTGIINYDNLKTPDHLALELDVISDWMRKCADELHLHKSSRVLIVSDHGASRLAVIRENEAPWEMKEKGEHSGRCCPTSEVDTKPNCATEENGYWVLANYDRFKGGRKSLVEVHGGATLEEVIVPVIEMALQIGTREVLVKNPTTKVGLNQLAAIDLFCCDRIENATVEMSGKRYPAIWNGDTLYHVEFPDLRRAGQYTVKVFDGDNYIQEVTFTAESAAGKMNKMDDFFK